MQTDYTTSLVEKNTAFIDSVMDMLAPRHNWKTRAVAIRHEKQDHDQEPYNVYLHHPPDHRLDGEEERVEKAADIPPGARWITVHPNGAEEEGQPVLITPNPDGTHSIVGGAGGKLNGLRLTGVKSPEEYRQMSAERRKTRTEAMKLAEQVKQQQLGDEAYEKYRIQREADRAKAKTVKHKAERDFIASAAAMQGVDVSKFEVPKDEIAHLEPEIAKRVVDQAHAAALGWARQVAANVKDRVVLAFDQVSRDSTGDLPIAALLNGSAGDGRLGYTSNVADMAAQNGLTDRTRKQQASEIEARSFLERSDYDLDQAIRKRENMHAAQDAQRSNRQAAQVVNNSLAQDEIGAHAIKDLPVEPQAENLGAAVDVLKAEQRMRNAVKQARELAPSNTGASNAMSAVLETTELSDSDALDAVAKSVAQQHMTDSMLRIVGGTNDLDFGGSMQQHYSVGISSALNDIAAAVDGSTVDPLLSDMLGASAAASALVARWRSTMAPAEFDAIKGALVDQHVATQEKIANEGMDRAEEFLKQAAAIEPIENPDTPEALDAALADHARKTELLKNARQCAGVARGKLEAAAAINEAALHAKTNGVQANLGPKSNGEALDIAYGLGLTEPSRYDAHGDLTHEGEFTIHQDGPNRVLEIHPAGITKLAHAPDPSVRYRAEQSEAIKNGRRDEAGWLPEGITRRPASTYELDPIQVRSADHQLSIGPEDDAGTINSKLRDHVGALLDSGRDALSIIDDIRFVGFQADLSLTPAQAKLYDDAIEELCPAFKGSVLDPNFDHLYDSHYKQLEANIHACGDEYIKRLQENGEVDAEQAALDLQRIPLDGYAQDALYRAVLADPRAQNAFMGASQVDHAGLRSWALENMLGVAPGSQEIISKITVPQRAIYDKWQALRAEHGASGIYKAIQADMVARHENDAVGSMFDDDVPVSSLATVDLTDGPAVSKCAIENARALGYQPSINPTTGATEFPDLIPGHVYYEPGKNGEPVASKPLTQETIERVARDKIKRWLRKNYVEQSLGMAGEGDFDPESVLTVSKRWTAFKNGMGGLERATKCVQDCMAGSIIDRFAKHYARSTGKQLKVGRTPVAHADRYARAAVNPEAAERDQRHTKRELAGVGKDRSGRFSRGDWKKRLKDREAMQTEGGALLGSTDRGEHVIDTSRATAGHAIEEALRGMMPYCPTNNGADAATAVTMSGDAIDRQRMTKLILANKRQGCNLTAGRGKTLTFLGAFTHARHTGDAKRALFVVPSNIVGQIGTECLKFVDPSAGLRWFSNPKANGNERREAMGSDKYHMVVTTPESLRNDIIDAVAEDIGSDAKTVARRLSHMPDNKVDELVHSAMEKRGWNLDYVVHDEGHRLLDRKGKPDAAMAKIGQSVGRRANYMVYSTADPNKNDVSEVFSALHNIAPATYPMTERDAFLRRYGRNTLAAKTALQREVAPYFYTSNASLGVEHERHTHVLPMTESQAASHQKVLSAYRQARLAHKIGDTDGLIENLSVLSPTSFGKGESDEEVADRLASSIGTQKEAALNRVTNMHADNAKLHWVDSYVGSHKGEPTVIFAHNHDAVNAIARSLKAAGHRVAVSTGKMSQQAKAKAKAAFQPSSGEPRADVLVCSDAEAMGANLQRGHHLINFDTPMTAMTHEQRIAREVRTGQLNTVSVHDLVLDNDFERRNRRRLEQKGGLREAMTAPTELVDDGGLAQRIHAARVAAMAGAEKSPDSPSGQMKKRTSEVSNPRYAPDRAA